MNKKGFTLIELLAVIIILGILMIIAIPSVTKYISDSRKNAYVDTAKEIVGGARNLVNEGKLEMYDTDTTYYIESSCIKTENASKSPYGEFTKAYVVVTYDGKGYTYYWTSNDDAGQGIKDVVRIDKLDTYNVESDLKDSEISTLRGIDGRSKTIVISKQNNCQKEGSNPAESQINGETGEEKILMCKRAKELHRFTCNRSLFGCSDTVGYGNEIVYGNLGTKGTLNIGDAFDCDVNNDGIYDAEKERFYYLSQESSNAVLIYYSNFSNGEPNKKKEYVYYPDYDNSKGPTIAYQQLPSISLWNNPKIIAPGTRQIVTDTGATTVMGIYDNTINLPMFTYTDKAARLPTYQEIYPCKKTALINDKGALDNCSFLIEGTQYEETKGNAYGYWLENPYSDWSAYKVWHTDGESRLLSMYSASNSEEGVRPVITTNKENLEI